MTEKRPPTALAERRRQLSQYRCLLREISEDKLRLAQLARRLLRQSPAGIPTKENGALQTEGYRARIQHNLDRCLSLVEELQAYINDIDDSEIRRIFTLRYINAYSWQRIAFAIGGSDESYARKKHDRYIEKHP